MLTATDRDELLAMRLRARQIHLTPDEVGTLRRAEMTLHRWAEGECGDSNDYNSWCIERDEQGKPWRVVYPHSSTKTYRTRIADREAGALRRVKALCDAHGLIYYHQGDPRGCALYVGKASDLRGPIDSNYTDLCPCAGVRR